MPTPTAPTIELVPLDDLHPDPANPRRISDEELDALDLGILKPPLRSISSVG